jgi:hypothetical protein
MMLIKPTDTSQGQCTQEVRVVSLVLRMGEVVCKHGNKVTVCPIPIHANRLLNNTGMVALCMEPRLTIGVKSNTRSIQMGNSPRQIAIPTRIKGEGLSKAKTTLKHRNHNHLLAGPGIGKHGGIILLVTSGRVKVAGNPGLTKTVPTAAVCAAVVGDVNVPIIKVELTSELELFELGLLQDILTRLHTRPCRTIALGGKTAGAGPL